MKIRSFISLAIVILFGVIGLIAHVFWYLDSAIEQPLRAGEGQVHFTINRGWGAKKISSELKEAGLIIHPLYFQYAVWRAGREGNLQAGDYIFPAEVSIRDIIDAISGNGRFADVQITFPEGLTMKEVELRLASRGFVPDFDDVRISDYSAEYPVFRSIPQDASLEGFLFPDTYLFNRDLSKGGIIAKFLSNFARKLEKARRTGEERKSVLAERSLYDVVIMASLVEQEVWSEEDRKIVSGILWKRLRVGMLLQVDAAVLYAKEKRFGSLGKEERGLTHEDFVIDSPYNTYRYPGLPPGPIANPGLISLTAALYPAESPYWYYLSKPDGTTVFSRTLKEHNAAKAKFLR